LISELSVHSQFLITTFKPELLQVMESTASMYEVTFKNRKSTLKPIEIARAFELINK
jgi:chromosome segregation ATPase